MALNRHSWSPKAWAQGFPGHLTALDLCVYPRLVSVLRHLHACLSVCTPGSPSQDNSVTEPVSPLFLIQVPHCKQCMLSLILTPATLDVGVHAFLTLFIGVHAFPSLPGTWKMRTLRLGCL